MKRAVLMTLALGCLSALSFVLSPVGNASAGKEVTFSRDIAAIFYKNCAECHRPNGIAPMSLLSYKEARPWARSIKEQVVSRQMPPWSPDPAFGEFTNDHRLAQKDIDAVVAWVDQGATFYLTSLGGRVPRVRKLARAVTRIRAAMHG